MPTANKVNCGAVLLALTIWSCAVSAQTDAQPRGILHDALRALRAQQRILSSVGGRHDTLEEYARKCDDATEIPVPAFDCMAGVKVEGQGNVPATSRNATTCDNPNVLNGVCDPGSRFQVLPGGNADAVAVAHCRKNGQAIDNHLFNDIAVIQYNKKNGAVCFYQALNSLPGRVPAPRDGKGPWDPNAPERSRGAWLSPEVTEGIGCTGCHDNGGFIRSRYLAALDQPPHVLPNRATGFDNNSTPLKFVGLDFKTNRTWSIEAPKAPNDKGPACNSCHRLAVSNKRPFVSITRPQGERLGTALHLAGIATAATQDSKNPHSRQSPIWMRPGQIEHDPGAEASARIYEACANGFVDSDHRTPPPGCKIEPLGEPWIEVEPAFSLAPIYYLLGFPADGTPGAVGGTSTVSLVPVYYFLGR
jgi:hypothetical protein